MSRCLTRLLLPVLLATLGTVLPDARAQTPPGALPFVTYGAEVGFGQWYVRDISQDSRGVLWVGTDDGIYLYDGYRFRRAAHQGLPSTHITRLVAGANGDMWCGTLEGWARWHAGGWTRYGTSQGLPGVWNDLRVDHTGRAWVAAGEGLFQEQEDGRFAPVPGWPGGTPWSLWLESGGDVYAVTGGALHHRGPDGRWRTWGEAQGVPREGLRHVARDGAGGVWIWSNYSMWRLPPGASAFEAVPGLDASRSLWSAVRNRHGTLWLASDKGLVEVGEDGRPRGVTGPPTQRVWMAFEDREGSLWVGGLGLFRLAGGGLWRTYSVRQGLPADEVWAIHRDAGGQLWAGTSKGLARATAEGWVPVAEVPSRAVRGIFQEPGGALWLSGSWAELLRYEPRTGRLERFGPEQGLSASVTMRVVQDGEGRLWVGTNAGVLRGERHGAGWRFVPVILPGGSLSETVFDVLVDVRGRVWIAGQAGLVVVEDNTLRRFTVADGFLRNSASYLLQRRDGQLCVTYFRVAGGVSCFRYDRGTPTGFTHLDTTKGLASDRIYQLGEDSAGRLWVGTGKGVDVFGREGQVHFSMADGLPGDDCNARAFWLDTNGDVWVGMSSGLGQFLARYYTGPPAPPGAVVASVRAGGLVLGPGPGPGPHEVPYPRNTL
ncbi:MAG TPA: two-component regulator propeller domain-containing protein, partial [Archangium sp.]|nr:two-component regulator propeller domain-containing protein [Archangium sp.]